MLTKEAIEALSEAKSITAAGVALAAAINNGPGDGLAALPVHYTVHDLEKALPNRRRPRGAMTTSVLADFHAYVAAHREPGAAVFVDQKTMAAVAVLNLGTPAAPGHADNTATLGLKQTAALKALLAITSGPKSQTAVAEFLEDWAEFIDCTYTSEDDAESHPVNVLGVQQAVIAVRTITIEGLTKVANEEKDLNKSRSTFDQVKVNNKVRLPSRIGFLCTPFAGLADRRFTMRLSVLTTDKPSLQLRIINQEKHDEEMAEELANLVRGLLGDVAPVHIGSYTPAK